MHGVLVEQLDHYNFVQSNRDVIDSCNRLFLKGRGLRGTFVIEKKASYIIPMVLIAYGCVIGIPQRNCTDFHAET